MTVFSTGFSLGQVIELGITKYQKKEFPREFPGKLLYMSSKLLKYIKVHILRPGNVMQRMVHTRIN